MLKSLTISLFLTIVIELTASLVLGIRNKEDIYVVILVNICTNPIVVFIANCLILIGSNKLIYNIIVIIMEIIVVFVEYIMYKKHLKNYKKSPLLLSLINNSVAYLINFWNRREKNEKNN